MAALALGAPVSRIPCMAALEIPVAKIEGKNSFVVLTDDHSAIKGSLIKAPDGTLEFSAAWHPNMEALVQKYNLACPFSAPAPVSSDDEESVRPTVSPPPLPAFHCAYH